MSVIRTPSVSLLCDIVCDCLKMKQQQTFEANDSIHRQLPFDGLDAMDRGFIIQHQKRCQVTSDSRRLAFCQTTITFIHSKRENEKR